MRILVQGDSHGNVKDIIPKIYIAGKHKIQHVMVVGDFGLWTHMADGQLFLDEVQEAARINNLSVYAIGGNHENWDHWNWIVDNFPTGKGFAMARSRVLLAPKAHRWTWAGKEFIGAGGAVSVDREHRLAQERGGDYFNKEWGMMVNMPKKGSGPRTRWWPNEQLTDEDVALIETWGKADYLFSHDCSNVTEFKSRLKPDIDSQVHRNRIDKVLASVQPKMHFHGHMHEQYDWVNTRVHGFYDPFEPGAIGTRTIGLEAFQDFNSWGVLEVETGEWYWPTQFYEAVEARAERKRAHDEARYAASGTD
jgi:Icc-related predicted phosphoesterase